MSSQPDTTFPTVGILGGGQLGKMMAAEAVRMSVDVRLLSPKDAGPMQAYSGAQAGDWTHPGVLRDFAEDCDVITVESEWAPAESAADAIDDDTDVWPSPQTLGWIKDKGVQNNRLSEAGCPVPEYECCETLDEALDTAETFGYPVMLKQYRGGYDGYGNATASVIGCIIVIVAGIINGVFNVCIHRVFKIIQLIFCREAFFIFFKRRVICLGIFIFFTFLIVLVGVNVHPDIIS